MSASRFLFDVPAAGGALLLVGVTLAALGTALAADFRGFTTWHVEKTFDFLAVAERPLRRVTPWNRLLATPFEVRKQRQLRLERVLGGIFAVFGVVVSLIGLVGLVGWAVT